jgi:predicted Zn finger-like uncharacterized protein
MCANCKTSYIVSQNDLGKRGARLKCNVCENNWYQTIERLMKTDSSHYIKDMTESKINEVKRIIADKNTPKYPRVDKVGIFVGNIPYDFGDKDIGDLFGEYGVTNLALVRDNEGQSKGYAFLEVFLLTYFNLAFLENRYKKKLFF